MTLLLTLTTSARETHHYWEIILQSMQGVLLTQPTMVITMKKHMVHHLHTMKVAGWDLLQLALHAEEVVLHATLLSMDTRHLHPQSMAHTLKALF